MGVDPNITSEVVLTGTQACEKPGKHWVDKPNAGYSGTPMWKLALERSQAAEEAARAAPSVTIPEGFKPTEKGSSWFFNEKKGQKGLYWNSQDGKQYVYDEHTLERVPLYEARAYETRSAVGACFHDRSSQVRHVLVRDLMKAGQALRMSLEHLDRPLALYALYEGHRGNAAQSGSGNVCAEHCVKHLHQKLLPKLSAFHGYWGDDRLASAMRESFKELDAEFAKMHPGNNDGCSAAVALITGGRLVVASLGDVACVMAVRGGEAEEMLKPHAIPDSDDEDDSDEDEGGGGAAPSGGPKPPIRWTRAFGDMDYKAPGSVPRLTAEPDVHVLDLKHRHHGFAFMCRDHYKAIGKSVAVSTVFRRSAGRPRMASGALLDAAVQFLGNVGDLSLGSIVVFFDRIEDADAPPQKRARLADPTQVRLRHILLKHRECKSTVDKVRNKQVKRTRGDAERQLRAVLEECATDQKMFSQRCKELSECQSCLKAGELIGDLGWVKPGKFGQTFDDTAFALQVGQLSDLVDTDQGVHVVFRSA